MENFDAIAKALNLTPTQLFEQLHSGKTLDEIAEAQGVDLAKVQEAANATRVQAMKDAIAQAVKDGKMTQDRPTGSCRGWTRATWGRAGALASAATTWAAAACLVACAVACGGMRGGGLLRRPPRRLPAHRHDAG